MPRFDYVRPTNIEQAVNLLNDPDHKAKPLAGGTDIMVYMHYEKPDYDRLVDISQIPELKKIQRNGDTISIGAGVTFTKATESQLLQETVPFLVEACRWVGGPQIRNLGTLGGNAANAAACADSLPVLVCLDTIAHLQSVEGERELPVTDMVEGPNKTQLKSNEIISHFTFKIPPEGVKTAFIKLGRRDAQAISRLTIAAMGSVNNNNEINFIHVTPGAATPRTIRFNPTEDFLLGKQPSESLFVEAGKNAAETMISITGRRWSTEYKEIVIADLTEKVLRKVFSA